MHNIKAYYDKLKGSTIACIGFFLSPLSWWNDPYVNVPIAYFCAWIISLYGHRLFLPAFIGSYLATNVLGFVLLHKGIKKTLSKNDSQKVQYTIKNFMKDLAISMAYTFLIILLVKIKVIQPPQNYMK